MAESNGASKTPRPKITLHRPKLTPGPIQGNHTKGYRINLCKKKLFRAILIACDAIVARVQGPASCCIWPDPCLEPESRVRCRGGRARHGCPASVTLTWCRHSGVNAAFCTLFNGSDGIHLAYAAYFGPFPSCSNLHCSILGHFHQYMQTGRDPRSSGGKFSSTAPWDCGGAHRLSHEPSPQHLGSRRCTAGSEAP